MKPLYKRYIIVGLGWLFIVLGLAGIVLPGLQGILFLLIGLGFLAEEYHWARKLLNTLKKRFPKADRKLHEIKLKFKGLLHKFIHKKDRSN